MPLIDSWRNIPLRISGGLFVIVSQKKLYVSRWSMLVTGCLLRTHVDVYIAIDCGMLAFFSFPRMEIQQNRII